MKSLIKFNDSLDVFCPYCKESHIIKQGFRYLKSGIKQRYECKDCKATFERWL